MGFLDMFRKSFDDEVAEALEKVRGMGLGVTDLGATVNGKVVTLSGTAPDLPTKARVMEAFNQLVDTENTVNLLQLPPTRPDPAKLTPEPEAPAAAEDAYEVVAGDTLGAIAQRYYGNAGKYMKIFDANRDILDDPNLIKVGQKLKIPRD